MLPSHGRDSGFESLQVHLMRFIYFVLGLLLISSSFAIVSGQSDSPQPKIISCEGHRQLDQVYYDVYFMNEGSVESNFRIGDKYSKSVHPEETSMITVAYPLPLEQHSHSAKVDVCVGGYLSFERCDSVTCTYTEGEAPEIDAEGLFGTSKLEETCLPAFVLLALGCTLILRSL